MSSLMRLLLGLIALLARAACADCEASGCASKSNQLLQSAKRRKLEILEHADSSVAPMLEMVQSFAELMSKEGNLTDSQKLIISRLNRTFYNETLPTITNRHNNDVELLKTHAEAISRCNIELVKRAQNASALQTAASLAKEAAQRCATEEAAVAAAKSSATAVMTAFLATARPPNSTMTEPREATPEMEQWLQKSLQFYESFNYSYSIFEANMSATALALTSKEKACDTKDASYKGKYCTWSAEVGLIKSFHATCRSEAVALYNKTLATALSNMQGRKADFLALKKVECFLKVLMASDAASASALGTCETQGSPDTTALEIERRAVPPAIDNAEIAALGEPNATICSKDSGHATTSTTSPTATTTQAACGSGGWRAPTGACWYYDSDETDYWNNKKSCDDVCREKGASCMIESWPTGSPEERLAAVKAINAGTCNKSCDWWVPAWAKHAPSVMFAEYCIWPWTNATPSCSFKQRLTNRWCGCSA